MRQRRTDLTAEVIRRILNYDPETGVFRWKRRADQSVQWNARYVGAIAGAPHPKGYRQISISGTMYAARRLAWLHVTGAWPLGPLNTKNLDKLDDRFDNLRPATNSQNMANKPLKATNTSGYKGVSFAADRGKWRAKITLNGKQINLGQFDTAEAAYAAYCAAAEKIHGEFARFD